MNEIAYFWGLIADDPKDFIVVLSFSALGLYSLWLLISIALAPLQVWKEIEKKEEERRLPLSDWFNVDCVLPRAEDAENGLIWVLFNNGDVARQHWELGGEKEAGGAYPIFWKPLSVEKQLAVRERIVREGLE